MTNVLDHKAINERVKERCCKTTVHDFCVGFIGSLIHAGFFLSASVSSCAIVCQRCLCWRLVGLLAKFSKAYR